MAKTQVRADPATATKTWVDRLNASTTQMTAGVDRVTTAPGAMAAAKFDKWLAGVQAGAAKWRRNVAAVGLDSWKTSMKNIGIPRVGQGATQKAGKYEAFATEFYPFLQTQMQAVAAMPDTTLEQRIAKSGEMQRRLSNFKRSGTATG